MKKKGFLFWGMGGALIIVMLVCIADILVTTLNTRMFYSGSELALIGGIMCVSGSVGMLMFEKVITDKKRLLTLRKVVFYCAFITYMVTIVTALFGTAVFQRYSSEKSFSERIEAGLAQANFVPFRVIMTYVRAFFRNTMSKGTIMVNLLGNLIFFMPMGIFLPVVIRKTRLNPCLTMLLFLILIELMQLLTGRGTFDVDDIFLNFVGFLIVYLITKTKTVKKLIKL